MAEINIIPLVDVTLVLLIIFMATTAFVKETGLNMKLPAAKTQETTADQNVDLNIALTRTGGIYLDGKASSEDQVQNAMLARARNNAETRVVIKGDEKIEYARVVRVMDMAKQAGLPRVALGTRLPEGS
jgi:biopolymer transport protein ExbD